MTGHLDDWPDDDQDDCWQCGGEGGWASCMEDCCPYEGGEEACDDPACWVRCDVCNPRKPKKDDASTEGGEPRPAGGAG
jgi:hypothetical protein